MSLKVKTPPAKVLFVKAGQEVAVRLVEARIRYAAPCGPVEILC